MLNQWFNDCHVNVTPLGKVAQYVESFQILPSIHKVSGMCSCWASLQQKATLWLFCAPLRWNMTFATLLKTTCWKLNEFRSTNQVCPYGVTVAFVFQRIHHILVLRLCRVCLSNNALKDWKNGWGPSWNHQLETFFSSTKARKLWFFGCMNSIWANWKDSNWDLGQWQPLIEEIRNEKVDFDGCLHHTCFSRKRRYIQML